MYFVIVQLFRLDLGTGTKRQSSRSTVTLHPGTVSFCSEQWSSWERTAAHKTAQAHGGLISKCVQSTQKLKQSLMFLQLRVFLPSCAALAVDSFRVVVVRGGAHAVQGRAACVAHGGDHPERVSGEAARLDARNTGTAQLSYEPYTPRDRRPTQNDALVRLTFCASWFRSLKC